MKNLIMVFLFSVPLTAAAVPSQFQTQNVRLACGISKDVGYYLSSLGIPAYVETISKSHDEDRRVYMGYPDGSWLITVEYNSMRSPDRNMSCIVNKGDKTTVRQGITTIVDTLPKDLILPNVL